MLKIIDKPTVVIKETEQEINGGEEVKFFGQINVVTFFVLIGKVFTMRHYTSRRNLCIGGPPVPREPGEEKHNLRLFVGPQDALVEIAVHECKYYPFNPNKETIVKSKDYLFTFPKKFVLINLTPIEKQEEGEKKFATCNNQWIQVFDHPDMTKPPNETNIVQDISNPQALQKFKRERYQKSFLY